MMTKYEVIARHDGIPALWLIGYTPRRSRPGLMAAMRNVGPQMIERLGISEDDQMTWHRGHSSTDPRCRIAGWEIRFSGQTQVDCRGCEHPFIGAKEWPKNPINGQPLFDPHVTRVAA